MVLVLVLALFSVVWTSASAQQMGSKVMVTAAQADFTDLSFAVDRKG